MDVEFELDFTELTDVGDVGTMTSKTHRKKAIRMMAGMGTDLAHFLHLLMLFLITPSKKRVLMWLSNEGKDKYPTSGDMIRVGTRLVADHNKTETLTTISPIHLISAFPDLAILAQIMANKSRLSMMDGDGILEWILNRRPLGQIHLTDEMQARHKTREQAFWESIHSGSEWFNPGWHEEFYAARSTDAYPLLTADRRVWRDGPYSADLLVEYVRAIIE